MAEKDKLEEQRRRAQQGPLLKKKLGPKGRGGGMRNEDFPFIKIDPNQKIFILTDEKQKMAKGGRAGFKSGSKGCKLAMKGKGRAYGKNS